MGRTPARLNRLTHPRNHQSHRTLQHRARSRSSKELEKGTGRSALVVASEATKGASQREEIRCGAGDWRARGGGGPSQPATIPVGWRRSGEEQITDSTEEAAEAAKGRSGHDEAEETPKIAHASARLRDRPTDKTRIQPKVPKPTKTENQLPKPRGWGSVGVKENHHGCDKNHPRTESRGSLERRGAKEEEKEGTKEGKSPLSDVEAWWRWSKFRGFVVERERKISPKM